MGIRTLAAACGGALLLALPAAAHAQLGGHSAFPDPADCRAGTDHFGPRAYVVTQCDADGSLRSRRAVQTIETVAGPRTVVTETERQAPGEADGVHDVIHNELREPEDPKWAHQPRVAANVPEPQGPQRNRDEADGQSGGSTTPWQERCTDTRWTYFAAGGLSGRYRPWYWYSLGTISDVNHTGARNAAIYAHGIWEQSYNDCGYGDLTNVSMPYRGDTSGGRTLDDGVNWVGFANVVNHCGGYFLGCAISRTVNGAVTETDIVLTRETNTWALTQTSGRYDVQAVTVHESGHAIGLHHPCGVSNDPSAYCADSLLSMAGARTNRVTQRHLGYGDLYGLWATNR